ncbi:hypothetical protein [Paraburkholderia fungorum]|uniref:Uncharacterized protein n=1 Tax=Paraburkholderia fungorum TaxID=134537 RepID=A0AAW3V9M1_9BURK|nr:hypothetical protein [Paraburkholderia fungorum]MBB4519455.1 hypothetical protein [Paraburkholderia fungorum]MBB6207288.1 hypothetical protein [Paraburkholderia fungorum]
MQRALATHERRLLESLLTVNRPFYGAYAQRWEAQIKTCLVHEVNVPYCLAISHDEIRLPSGGYTTLARELIGIDEGVPLLIYAYAVQTQAGYVLDSFDIDRLDGEPLVAYPEPGDSLMIMEAGKRIGGADLRQVFKESDLLPRFKLPRDRLDREAG